MYAVTLHGPRDVRLDNLPAFQGQPPSGTALIRTIVSGISAGTEMAAITARYGTPFYGWPFDYPSVLGYLNVGRVAAVGPDVPDVAVGDVLYTFRQHRQEFLFPVSDPYWQVPPTVDPASAVFAYLISLAAHGLRRAGLVPGETVAVVGLGVVGLGGVAMAKQFGSSVTAIDPIARRREIALALGADRALDPGVDDVGATEADVVVEASDSWSGVATALEAVRQEGRIAIAAIHPSPAPFSPLGELFYAKQVALFSTSFQSQVDWPHHVARFTLRRGCQDVLDRLEKGVLDFGPAVTHRVPYRQLPAIFTALEDGSLDAGGVAVEWQRTDPSV
jgi:threonine dehydrogenase-like Zn-dependent dehydrogenase